MPVALITGANRGLGLEFATQYLNNKYDIVAMVRQSSDELDALTQRGKVQVLTGDLTDDDALRDAVKRIGPTTIDLLVHNAGTMGRGVDTGSGIEYQPFGRFDRSEWREIFDINVFTPMYLTTLLVDHLRTASRPKVAIVTSQLGSIGNNLSGGMYGYRSSKAAVNSIAKSLSVNLKDYGIVTLALHPGWVRTRMGGENATVTPHDSVAGMRSVIARATLKDTGRFLSYEGKSLPW
jgi:NAD(P)-dependent dehydrogenase (short-subunit alcohol dehydrogenase family)